jgi:hypothetical protein
MRRLSLFVARHILHSALLGRLNERTNMKMTFKIFAIATFVAASAASAFAASRHDRDYGQAPQFEYYDQNVSNGFFSPGRESMVKMTGN